MEPYSLGTALIKKSEARLHLNEYQSSHSSAVIAALQQTATQWADPERVKYYTQGPSHHLYAALASYSYCTNNNIAIAAGSDEILRSIIDYAATRVQCVLLGVPSYTHFKMFATLRGTPIQEYALGLETSIEEHVQLLQCYHHELKNGALVYLGSPNNPTRGLWTPAYAEFLAQAYPMSIFIFDEAYIEYASLQAKKDVSLSALAIKLSNVIITRTFSKLYGLANLRVGYAIASVDTIKALKVGINIKTFNILGEHVVLAALRSKSHYMLQGEKCLKDTSLLIADLRKKNFLIWPKAPLNTNFFLLYVGDTRRYLALFASYGIHVRDRTLEPGLQGCIRISAAGSHVCQTIYKILCSCPPPTSAIQQLYSAKGVIAELRLLFAHVLSILYTHSIQTWFDGGSLLGMVRHKGLLPWASNIELGFFYNKTDPFASLISVFGERGLNLYSSDNCWIVSRGVSDVVQIRLYPHSQRSGITPLQSVLFYNIIHFIPANHLSLLEHAYGANFMTTACIKFNKYTLINPSPA